ncbi:MAG: hypothetical protein ACI8YN_000348 [Porticoccaceae bacterium]|jgi:hypothetical protein
MATLVKWLLNGTKLPRWSVNIRVHLFIMTALFPLAVSSTEKIVNDYEDVLMNACETLKINPNQEGGQLCQFYIRGILDSSDNKESATLAKESAWAAFEKRAYRTRVGSRGTKNIGPQFCIPAEAIESSVIEKITRRPSFPDKTTKTLATTIRVTLSSEYPCE